MNSESASRGVRPLDVLDLHYDTEATGRGTRVNNPGAGNSDCVVAVRVQAPRSLADPLDLRARTVRIQLTHSQTLGTARPQGNALTLTLPPESITTVELTP